MLGQAGEKLEANFHFENQGGNEITESIWHA